MSHPTFVEYLMELQVSDDPTQAIKDVKQAARNPDRFKNEQTARTVDDQKEIQRNADDPLKSDKLRLAKMKQQLLAQEKRLGMKEKSAANQAGVAPVEGQA